MKLIAKICWALCLVFLAGCGQDQYAIERQYYRVKKEAQTIFKSPRSIPPNQLQKTVGTLRGFALKYPQSNLAADAQFSIANLYAATENYADARTQLSKIISLYPKLNEIVAQAIFLKGGTYEAQNNWNSALAQYQKLMLEYPLTQRGAGMPLYIAQHYKAKFQPDKMIQAYRDAIAFYNGLAGKYPGTPLALQSQTLIAQCYGELKEWQNAISTLNTISAKYKDKVSMDGVLMNIALIYARELKDSLKATEALQRLIRDYPKSKLIDPAKKIIRDLEQSNGDPKDPR